MDPTRGGDGVHRWGWLTGCPWSRPAARALLAGAPLALAGLLLLRRDRSWWTAAFRWPSDRRGRSSCVVVIDSPCSSPGPTVSRRRCSLWIGAGLLGLALLALGLARAALVGPGRSRRSPPPWSSSARPTAIDTVYGAYPTVATALQLPPDDARAGRHGPRASRRRRRAPTVAGLAAAGRLPAHGAVIRGRRSRRRASGFAARPAWVYVPPAYLTAPLRCCPCWS